MNTVTKILGFFAGIMGILMCGILIICGLWAKVNDFFWEYTIILAIVGLAFNILGSIGIGLKERNLKSANILVLCAFVINGLLGLELVINAPTPMYFVIETVVAILFWVVYILWNFKSSVGGK